MKARVTSRHIGDSTCVTLSDNRRICFREGSPKGWHDSKGSFFPFSAEQSVLWESIQSTIKLWAIDDFEPTYIDIPEELLV